MLRVDMRLWIPVLTVMVACGGATEDGTLTDAPTAAPTATAVPPTATAIPNQRPAVEMGRVEQVGAKMLVPLTVSDADDELLSVEVTWSFDGSVFYPCTRGEGSDNTSQIPPGSEITFVWQVTYDLATSSSVYLRAIAYDGHQYSEPDVTVRTVDIDLSTPTPAIEPPTEGEQTDVLGTPSPTPGELTSSPGEVTGEDSPSPGGSEAPEVSASPGGESSPTPDPDPFVTPLPHPDIDEVGGYADVEVEGKGALINLNPSGAQDNTREEYLIIFVNTASKAASYFLGQSGEDLGTPTPDASSPTPAEREAEPEVAAVRTGRWSGAPMDRPRWSPVQPSYGRAPEEDPSVGVTQQTFWVLGNLNKDTYKAVRATLGFSGGAVNIFVDQDIPIDWDLDCDGVIEPADGEMEDRLGRETFGFDSCDLEEVGQVVNDNILRNLRAYFGDESDVNEDGAVTILLTPILNSLNSTNSDTDDDGRVVEVMANPEVDLAEYDPIENPGSNEQEMIFLPAPDPGGLFNPDAGGGGEDAIDQYVTFTMAANIARATELYISYNQHVLVGEGEAEEEWLDTALANLAADLCGFGALIYEDVFSYLAAPHLQSLDTTGEDANQGPAWLFLRYLVDRYGVEILAELMASGTTGTDNLDTAIVTVSDSTADFYEALADYATVLLLADAASPSGGPLISPQVLPGFKPATTVTVTGSNQFPGAEGFQMGINIEGVNTVRNRSEGALVATDVFNMDGSDWTHYTQGVVYGSYLKGLGSFQAVRVGGLLQKRAYVKMASSQTLMVRVVRLPDPPANASTFVLEQVFGARSATDMPLDIRADGWPSVVLGDIDPSEAIDNLLDSEESVVVTDTDIYTIDLSDIPSTAAHLEIRANRRLNKDGKTDLSDLQIVVVPRADLPDAEVVQGSYVCDGKTRNVDYPNSYLEYLAEQTVLDAPLIGEDDPGSSGSSTCDFDGDEIPDASEERPTGLVEQVSLWQDEELGGASSVYPSIFYPFADVYTTFVDGDSLDDDSSPYVDTELGISTVNSLGDGEEAFLRVSLPAGDPSHVYSIVVAGPDSLGPYEMAVRLY